MLNENKIFIIKENDCNRRIDRVLRKFLKHQPLSKIYSAIRTGKIKVNNKKIKQNYITQKDDSIIIFDKFLLEGIEEEKNTILDLCSLKPEVILKTEHLLFINKKRGEIIHGENSLSDQVLCYHKPKKQSISFTSGPLHRLDKDTSGIITFSQSLKGAQEFSLAIKTKKIHKYYLGIIEGLEISPVLKSTIEGKNCLTYTKIIASNSQKNISLIEFKLVTGRKHQIRIQCKQENTPLLYDSKYNTKYSLKKTNKNKLKYFLHAKKIEFSKDLLKTDVFKNLPSSIEANLPKYFKEFIRENFDPK